MDANQAYSDIILIADASAAKFEKESRGKAINEFLFWFNASIDRETIVAEAYDDKYIVAKIEKLEVTKDVKQIIRRSIKWVRSQETAHKVGVVSAVDIINPAKLAVQYVVRKFNLMVSELKGVFFGLSRKNEHVRHLAALISIIIGRKSGTIPAFITDLAALKFQDDCVVNMALEYTAIKGYERMIELIPLMEQQEQQDFSDQPLEYMLKRIHDEEQYHFELFKYYSRFPPVGPFPPPRRPFNPNDPGGGPKPPSLKEQLTADLAEIQTKTLGSSLLTVMKVDHKALANDTILLYMNEYFGDKFRDDDDDPEGGNSNPVGPGGRFRKKLKIEREREIEKALKAGVGKAMIVEKMKV